MNRDYGESHFTTQYVIDTKDGYSGFDLYRKSRINQGDAKRVARILFWDACGQLYLETFNADIPVKIVEELIAETKEQLRIDKK